MAPNRWLEAFLILLILGILLLVFWPLTSNTPRAAYRSMCLMNLKVIGFGANIYRIDFEERYPLASHWMDALGPYTKNDSTFHCSRVKVGDYGYAMSRQAAGVKYPGDAKAAKRPLVFDSSILERNAVSDLSSLPIQLRHGPNNVGYMDGHAKSLLVSAPL